MGLLDTILGKSWVAHFFNPNHVRAGSPTGGQFTSGKGGASEVGKQTGRNKTGREQDPQKTANMLRKAGWRVEHYQDKWTAEAGVQMGRPGKRATLTYDRTKDEYVGNAIHRADNQDKGVWHNRGSDGDAMARKLHKWLTDKTATDTLAED
jgi:hypothetical protein